MYFETFSDAVSMAGHGPYVWSAYGITLLVLLVLMSSPLRRQRRLLRELRGEQRRLERQPPASREAQSQPQTQAQSEPL